MSGKLPLAFLGICMLSVGAAPAHAADGPASARAALALARRGDPASAIPLFNTAINSGAFSGLDLANLYYDEGNAYQKVGMLDAAVTSYKIAIRFNPKLAVAYYNLGLVHLGKRQPRRAIADFGMVIKLQPDNAGAVRNQAYAYSLLNGG